MNQILVLLLLICGQFSQVACLSSQSVSSPFTSPITSNPDKDRQYETPPLPGAKQHVDALFQAILKNDLEGVISALGNGANPNAVTNIKEIGIDLTPLALAVGKKERIVDLLLTKGANPNTFSKFYLGRYEELRTFSPLMRAAQLGEIKVVRLLLDNNADVNLRSEAGFPTLFASLSHTEILCLMLEKGADPNIQDDQGVTPLIAVISGPNYDKTKFDRLKLLVERGANPDLKDKNGRTALDIARSFTEPSTIEFLQKITNTEKQSSLIGILETKSDGGYVCYLAPLSESNKMASDRRYYFLDDDLGGTMNIEGKDVFLELSKSYEIKPRRGKKRVVWEFRSPGITARFDLTVTKTTNDGANVHYDALINVTKGKRKDSVRAKGFCGG